MKKILISVSSLLVVSLIIINSFVLSAGEGNVKSQLFLSNIASYAWGTYWDPEGSSSNSNTIERTPSESTNNTCTFTTTVSITVATGTSYSLTGTLSQNIGAGGNVHVVSVNYNLGTSISATTSSSNSNSTTYTHQVQFTKSNYLFRDCLNQDYVTVCEKYSECNDLIKHASLFAQDLASSYN